MNSFTERASPARFSAPLTLAIGDVVALLLFVILGRLSHGFTSDWLINVARIATPFLVGWFAVALLVGAYRLDLLRRPPAFLGWSALAWLVGNGIAFVLRSLVFQNNVTLPFALTTLAFTGLFLLSWRGIYAWWYNHRK